MNAPTKRAATKWHDEQDVHAWGSTTGKNCTPAETM